MGYFDRDTYRYHERATCILPMTMATHDPTNARVLDVSGKGNHFTLGAGDGGATTPSKMATHGYTFDGADYFKILCSLPNQAYTVSMLLKSTMNFGGRHLLDASDSGIGSIYQNGGADTISASSGTVYVNGKQTASAFRNAIEHICVSGITLSPALSIYIGAVKTFNVSQMFNGSIFYFALYPFALTPTQIIDEMLFAKSGLNQV